MNPRDCICNSVDQHHEAYCWSNYFACIAEEERGSAEVAAACGFDEVYYLSGSGELSNDDSYIDYLNK